MIKEFSATVGEEVVNGKTIEEVLGWALQKARETQTKSIEVREIRVFKWTVTEFGGESAAP